jgi:hypothetical protein
MKRIIIIPILMFSLLFLVSCGPEEDGTGAANGAFIGGAQGIVAVFEPFGVEEDNTFTIFDTETFPIELTIANKGEYEIKASDVTIELKGPSLDFSGIASLSKSNSGIVGIVSELLPDGEEETITFATDAKYAQEVNGYIDREWFANIEYNYETYVVMPDICLKGDLKDDRICDVDGAKTYFVSGAPITVTAVEESTAGKGIMALKITVQDQGTGKVTLPTQDFGTQEKIAYSIDDNDWECKQGGKLNEARLIEGKADIICKLKNALSEKDLATKQLKLTLDYKYRDIIQESIRIKESDK